MKSNSLLWWWSTLVGVLWAVLLVALAGATIQADAGNGAHFETFPLTCDGVTYLNTASPGHWSVGHIAGETGTHLVPYNFSLTIIDLVTGETLVSIGYTKPGERGGEPVLCTNHAEDVDPDTGHLISVDFTSLAFVRG